MIKFSMDSNFIRISVLLLLAKSSRAVTKEIIKDCGSSSQRKIRSIARLDAIETEIG